MAQLDHWSLPLPRIAMGALAAVTGTLVIASPILSRGMVAGSLAAGCVLLGILRLLPPGTVWNALAAVVWVAIGLAIAIWPGHGLEAMGTVASIGLLVNGVTDCISRFAGVGNERRGLILPIATFLAGIASLIWADLSIMPVCIILGVALVARGVGALWSRRHGQVGFSPGLMQTIGAVLALVVAFAAVGAGAWVRTPSGISTEFYEEPDSVPAEPGILIRSEPYEHEQVPDNATAWRILYTTSRADDSIAVASGVVIVPSAPSVEPLPVIAWAHGTTGFAEACAPSLLDASFEAGAMFVLDDVIDQGWAMVAPDYPGLGTAGPHPYLIGEPTARSVLDAVRAARQMDGSKLSDQTVVWGHSQGGHAALWAGIASAAGYAPEVPILGIAALAPAANLTGLVANLDDITGGPLFGSFVLAAYQRTYPDVKADDYVKPGVQVAIAEMSRRCLADRSTLISIATLFTLPESPWSRDPLSGPLGTRIVENEPRGVIEVPLLIAQGLDDSLITPGAQAEYVSMRCERDDTVDYRTYEGRDHVPLVEADSPLIPDLLQWTHDRLDGVTPVSTCT